MPHHNYIPQSPQSLGRPQNGPAFHNTPLRMSPGGVAAPSKVAQKSTRAKKSRVRVTHKPQETWIGNPREEALEVTAQVANSKSPERSDKEHTMLEQPSLLESKFVSPNKENRKLLENLLKNKAKPNFGLQTPARSLHTLPGSNINPFAALDEDNPEEEEKEQDNLEVMQAGWTFQGKKKHTPTISPRPDPPQFPSPTTILEVTPGRRRKRVHSDVHCSYFSSLGISTPPGQDHARARVWPVLSRDKSEQRELLFCAKNNALPGLPLSIRISGSPEEQWTQSSAQADFTQCIETELEDKVLRYSLSIRDRLSLEWSWHEDQTRGGWECTILAHINTGASAINVQNKRHLHWRLPDALTELNNDI